MTFAEALNDQVCSCGFEDGTTWLLDGNGNEPVKVGEYTLAKNNRGIRVEIGNGHYAVEGFKDGTSESVWASFPTDRKENQTWTDLSEREPVYDEDDYYEDEDDYE